MFVVFSTIDCTEVVAELVDRSVPDTLAACTPLNPRLCASTVDAVRSTDTLPLEIFAASVEPRPPPMNTALEVL